MICVRRARLRILQHKFTHLTGESDSNFHRAVSEMRESTALEERNREIRRQFLITQLPWCAHFLWHSYDARRFRVLRARKISFCSYRSGTFQQRGTNRRHFCVTCNVINSRCYRFRELEDHMPDTVIDDWHFKTILEKLSKYGHVSHSRETCNFSILQEVREEIARQLRS